MRCIVTASDQNGRSYVLREETTLDERRFRFWDTTAGDHAAFPPDGRDLLDVKLPPGESRLIFVHYEPNYEVAIHWTQTLDFDVVLEGQVDLELDDGPVTLNPGDGAVVAGVRHGWHAGPDGCALAVVLNGISPRAE